MTNNLPARFSEPYFRRYEDHIDTIVNLWPKPVDFTVQGSVTTFACRLRDAMRSLHENNWTTKINRQVFNQIYRSPKDKSFVVQECANGIVKVTDERLIGSKDTAKVVLTKPSQPDTVTLSGEPFIFETVLTFDKKKFLCHLAHLRLLCRPIILDLDEQEKDELINSYDILLEPQTEGKYLLT